MLWQGKRRLHTFLWHQQTFGHLFLPWQRAIHTIIFFALIFFVCCSQRWQCFFWRSQPDSAQEAQNMTKMFYGFFKNHQNRWEGQRKGCFRIGVEVLKQLTHKSRRFVVPTTFFFFTCTSQKEIQSVSQKEFFDSDFFAQTQKEATAEWLAFQGHMKIKKSGLGSKKNPAFFTLTLNTPGNFPRRASRAQLHTPYPWKKSRRASRAIQGKKNPGILKNSRIIQCSGK